MAVKRIMVIDDEVHIRRVVELKLQSAGYDVKTAVNVQSGLDAIPGIAGRSPSYLMRQLHDFQTGARAGTGGDLMTPIVE